MTYFIIIVLIGIFAKKFVKNSFDLLVAGRNLGLTLTIFAIAGEWLGGTSTVAVGQWAYKYGISPMWYNISTSIGILIFGLTWATLYRRKKIVTIPEMLERLYDKNLRIIAAVFFIAAYLFLSSVQISSIGSLFSGALNININIAIIIAGLGITIYTLAGGMFSVALTNFIHVLVIWFSLGIAYFWYMNKVGWYPGITAKLNALAGTEAVSLSGANALNPFGMGTSKVLAWIIGGIAGAFAAQASVQPIFAAKDTQTAKKASLLAPVIIAPLGIIVTTIVMASVALNGGYASLDTRLALPLALMKIPNSLMGGFAMAGVFAAIASTEALVLLGMATMFTKDIYQKINKESSDKKIALIIRINILFAGIISIIMALTTKELPVATYLNYAMRSSAFIILAAGIYWAKPSPKSAIISIISAFLVAGIWYGFYIYKGNYPFGFDVVFACILISIITLFLSTFLIPGGRRRLTPKELLED
jgi:SSS family solute:Na+ symporter